MLTDEKCKEAKAKEKPYKLGDRDGLYLFITPSGAKSWRYNYRIAGVGEALTIGLHPEISLEDARDKLAKARKLVAKGQSPAAAWGMGDSCGADENAQAAHCSFVEPGGGVF